MTETITSVVWRLYVKVDVAPDCRRLWTRSLPIGEDEECRIHRPRQLMSQTANLGRLSTAPCFSDTRPTPRHSVRPEGSSLRRCPK